MTITLNKFDDISHLPLRVFNRVVFLNNLFADSGPEAASTYIALFDEPQRQQMYVMGAYIKKIGQDAVRKEVTKGLVLVDQDYEHVE